LEPPGNPERFTYDQFVSYGIRRESIFKTIVHLEHFGWIEMMRGGVRGFARSWPNRFRLTHRPTRKVPQDGKWHSTKVSHEWIAATDEWRRYRSKKLN
jgi:hypothetical protein